MIREETTIQIHRSTASTHRGQPHKTQITSAHLGLIEMEHNSVVIIMSPRTAAKAKLRRKFQHLRIPKLYIHHKEIIIHNSIVRAGIQKGILIFRSRRILGISVSIREVVKLVAITISTSHLVTMELFRLMPM